MIENWRGEIQRCASAGGWEEARRTETADGHRVESSRPMIIHKFIVLSSPHKVFIVSELWIRSNGLRVRERKQRGRVNSRE